jgi:predicted GTPase
VDLANVVWLGGATGSGKSSIARELARRHDLQLCNIDHRTWRAQMFYFDTVSVLRFLDKAGIGPGGRNQAKRPRSRGAAQPARVGNG